MTQRQAHFIIGACSALFTMLWCKHWRKNTRAPGEIGVYDAEVD